MSNNTKFKNLADKIFREIKQHDYPSTIKRILEIEFERIDSEARRDERSKVRRIAIVDKKIETMH